MQQMLSDMVSKMYDMDMVERRERMSKLRPTCDECGTEQVQLVDWSTPVVRFKCRRCGHKFTYEE